ncbi:MAG: ECF transporter S component [Planctomycetota bacterium]|jgi:energy-coupling factor transport system substrate-specific component
MNRDRRYFFTLHELLIMAALAALGGVSSSAVSLVGAAVHAVTGLPGGLQFLAGIHVLWLVLAVGLVRKPGAATVTSLLKSTVELLSGNPHGLLVVIYSVAAGAAVDAIWLLLARRDRPITYALAGGAGAASNVLVLKFIASLPDHRGVTTALAVLAGIAFISGIVLAGLLGWSLLQALRLAGAAGAQGQGPVRPRRPLTWAGVALWGAAIALFSSAAYWATSRADLNSAGDTGAAQAPHPIE